MEAVLELLRRDNVRLITLTGPGTGNVIAAIAIACMPPQMCLTITSMGCSSCR